MLICSCIAIWRCLQLMLMVVASCIPIIEKICAVKCYSLCYNRMNNKFGVLFRNEWQQSWRANWPVLLHLFRFVVFICDRSPQNESHVRFFIKWAFVFLLYCIKFRLKLRQKLLNYLLSIRRYDRLKFKQCCSSKTRKMSLKSAISGPLTTYSSSAIKLGMAKQNG